MELRQGGAPAGLRPYRESGEHTVFNWQQIDVNPLNR